MVDQPQTVTRGIGDHALGIDNGSDWHRRQSVCGSWRGCRCDGRTHDERQIEIPRRWRRWCGRQSQCRDGGVRTIVANNHGVADLRDAGGQWVRGGHDKLGSAKAASASQSSDDPRACACRIVVRQTRPSSSSKSIIVNNITY